MTVTAVKVWVGRPSPWPPAVAHGPWGEGYQTGPVTGLPGGGGACLPGRGLPVLETWYGICGSPRVLFPAPTPMRMVPLKRHITLLLLVKLALIIAIKLTFFSQPVKPGSEGTARALLEPTPTERNATHE